MGRPEGGRPKADHIWERVTEVEDPKREFKGKRVKCKDCGLIFAASANRIKSHINKIKGQGIGPCPGPNKGVTSDQKEKFIDSQGLTISDIPTDHNKLNETMLDYYISPKTMWEGIMALREMQENKETKRQKRIQVGPFFVSTVMNERDVQLIQYVFDYSHEPHAVFSSSHLHLNQSDFTTLKPQTFLDRWVIDAFAEILTNIERNKTRPLNWFLPVTFSTAALHGEISSFMDFVTKHKIREDYMPDFVYCEKIFVPVHFEKNSLGHFYLYVIHMKNREIEIWDSLSDQFVNNIERAETTQKLLLAMENLFPIVKFTKFHQTMAKNILLQPNGDDCGIFVINFMQQSDNYMKRNPLFQFDSEEERIHLALKLLKSDLNKVKETLYHKARRQNAQGENDEDSNLFGCKRKRVDTCKTCSGDVRRGTYIELDNSNSIVRRTDAGLKTGNIWDVTFCCDKANLKRGPWSPKEDAKLKSYIEKYGIGGNWIALPKKIGLKRSGKSCRLRWLNYLRPNIKHGGFSEEEETIICALYVSIGSRWSIIAAQLPGRTNNDIRNYWNTRLKKKLLGKQRKDQQSRSKSTQEAANTNTITSNSLFVRGNYINTTIPQPYWPHMSVLSPLPYLNQDPGFNDQDFIERLLINPDLFPYGTPCTQPVREEQANTASCMISNGMTVDYNQLELAQETGGVVKFIFSNSNDKPQRLDGPELLFGEDITVDDMIAPPLADTTSFIYQSPVPSNDQGMPQQCAFPELMHQWP